MKTSLVMATMGSALAALFVSSISSAAVTKCTADLDFDDADNSLKGTITLTGLGATTAQHIHKGACGVNGGVEFAIDDPKNDEVKIDETLDGAQATALAAGELYINFHTAANAGGEIRGQLYAMGSG